MKDLVDINDLLKTEIKAINTPYFGTPEEFVRCPKCGELAKLDPEILTSYPPKRRYRCSHCGEIGTDFCYNLHIIYGNEQKSPWNIDEPLPSINATSITRCIICGDLISVNAAAEEPSAHVCENCKKAILKLRKMLEEEDND